MQLTTNLKKTFLAWGTLILWAFTLIVPVATAAQTSGAAHALFDLTAPTKGPFPSNRFTVEDASHNTWLRVNLPLPDCAARPSDCEDVRVLNTLDGFNLQPRLSIPFDGPINPLTVNSDSVFLISLGSTLLDRGDPRGTVIGINQVVWDPATNTVHVESNEVLTQHTRYALIVRNWVRGQNGLPVEASRAFRQFRERLPWALREYRSELNEALRVARRLGIREQDIVTASVFTTQSTTAVLEKIRDQIKAATPAPANFLLGSGGTRTVFALDAVTSLTGSLQTRDNPPAFSTATVGLATLRIIPGAVGTIAFGKYRSPDYEVHPGEYIPTVGTYTHDPAVQGVNDVFFNLYLPSGPKPAGG